MIQRNYKKRMAVEDTSGGSSPTSDKDDFFDYPDWDDEEEEAEDINDEEDFVDAADFVENELLADCTLSPDELDQFLTPPSVDKWQDILSSDNPTFVTMDSSKETQWKIAKNEILHVRKRLTEISGKDDIKEVNKRDILFHTLGPDSDVGMYLKKELELSDEIYLKFMATLCIQSAYRVSSSQLFCKDSLLKGSAKVDEETYNKIWLTLAEKKKVSRSSVSTSRREKQIWS